MDIGVVVEPDFMSTGTGTLVEPHGAPQEQRAIEGDVIVVQDMNIIIRVRFSIPGIDEFAHRPDRRVVRFVVPGYEDCVILPGLQGF